MPATLKESSVTIRVEESLRDEFNDAAARIGRPAAQVLRELMGDFILLINATHPPVASAAARQRREAAAFALGNSELEGYKTSATQRALFEQYASGQITIEQLGEAVDRLATEFRATV